MNRSLPTYSSDRRFREAFQNAVWDVAPLSDPGAVAMAAMLAALTATSPPDGTSRLLFAV